MDLDMNSYFVCSMNPAEIFYPVLSSVITCIMVLSYCVHLLLFGIEINDDWSLLSTDFGVRRWGLCLQSSLRYFDEK